MSTAVVFARPLDVIPEGATSRFETVPRPVEKQNLVRLLLQGGRALNDELDNPAMLANRFVQLLAISVCAFAIHGAIVGGVAQVLEHDLTFFTLQGHPVIWVPAALVVSLIGALGLCLPVFLFCGQVSGIDASPALVAVQALRANATSALALFGLLPVYIAVGLGSLWWHSGADAAVALGFALPILAGLFGITAIHRGFADLAERQGLAKERRGLLKAMVVCASLVYAVVAPVALAWLCHLLSGRV